MRPYLEKPYTKIGLVKALSSSPSTAKKKKERKKKKRNRSCQFMCKSSKIWIKEVS
jgi:hypothetical protein